MDLSDIYLAVLQDNGHVQKIMTYKFLNALLALKALSTSKVFFFT